MCLLSYAPRISPIQREKLNIQYIHITYKYFGSNILSKCWKLYCWLNGLCDACWNLLGTREIYFCAIHHKMLQARHLLFYFIFINHLPLNTNVQYRREKGSILYTIWCLFPLKYRFYCPYVYNNKSVQVTHSHADSVYFAYVLQTNNDYMDHPTPTHTNISEGTIYCIHM